MVYKGTVLSAGRVETTTVDRSGNLVSKLEGRHQDVLDFMGAEFDRIVASLDRRLVGLLNTYGFSHKKQETLKNAFRNKWKELQFCPPDKKFPYASLSKAQKKALAAAKGEIQAAIAEEEQALRLILGVSSWYLNDEVNLDVLHNMLVSGNYWFNETKQGFPIEMDYPLRLFEEGPKTVTVHVRLSPDDVLLCYKSRGYNHDNILFEAKVREEGFDLYSLYINTYGTNARLVKACRDDNDDQLADRIADRFAALKFGMLDGEDRARVEYRFADSAKNQIRFISGDDLRKEYWHKIYRKIPLFIAGEAGLSALEFAIENYALLRYIYSQKTRN